MKLQVGVYSCVEFLVLSTDETLAVQIEVWLVALGNAHLVDGNYGRSECDDVLGYHSEWRTQPFQRSKLMLTVHQLQVEAYILSL